MPKKPTSPRSRKAKPRTKRTRSKSATPRFEQLLESWVAQTGQELATLELNDQTGFVVGPPALIAELEERIAEHEDELEDLTGFGAGRFVRW
jgi:hypothetical protein